MAYLQLHDRQIPLRAGETTIGASSGVDIVIEGIPATAPAAVVVAGPAGVVVRQGGVDAGTRVNGVALGLEPVPLIHGDRLELGPATLIFGDAAKGGSTAFFSGANVAELLKERSGGAAPASRQPTGNTGGRLVSLVDGREYVVLSKPFTIGRDPACDVVIASGEVSRTHAEIESGAEGYYVIDTSTNGVAVNGVRVNGTMTLARGDVIRIGAEEFRFYADKLPAASPSAAAPASAAPASAPAAAAPIVAVPPAAAPVTAAPVVAPPAVGVRPALAHLEVHATAGIQPADLTDVLTQVGRGAHNDIVIREDSVSDSHAKLQRRGEGWVVVDMQSTNGTFVDGARVEGELSLGPTAELKFGAIRATFRVAGVPVPMGGKGETAVLSSALAAQLAQAARTATVSDAPAVSVAPAVPKPRPAASPAPVPPPAASGGVPAWVWLVVALVVAGGAYFFLQGR